MKNFIYLLFVFFVTSCKVRNDNHDSQMKSELLNIKVFDNVGIIGTWTMCSMFSNMTSIQMNACTKITFNANGMGIVERSSAREDFHWSLKKNNLKILNIESNSSATFSDTSYLAFFDSIENRKHLTISQSEKSIAYYLTR